MMKKMLAAAVLMAAGMFPAQALEVLKADKLHLNIHGRGQMIGVGQGVPDPYRQNGRMYLFLKQARLGFNGDYDGIKFETLAAFGGENANGANTDLGLLDFYADIPLKALGDDAWFKIGQFRAPFSREGLQDRGHINFGERSLMNMASYQGRDYGLALMKTRDAWTGTFAVMTAGGRDVPQRYLPEVLGLPAMVARFGWNDGVDQDIYHVVGTDLDLKRTTKAAYLNMIYMKDTLIGHSTVLNVRTIDKNLLIDPNYNPFVSAGPNRANGNAGTLQRGDLWWLGADAVVRHPLGEGKAVEAEIEGVVGGFDNRYGSFRAGGARAQLGYQFQPYHVGLRYAALFMDRDTNYRTAGRQYSPAMGSAMHEITPTLTWHIKGHNMKVVADAPVYLNMPVFIEKGVGSYVFASQPGQVTLIGTGGNTVRRYTVFEGRMMFQFQF